MLCCSPGSEAAAAGRSDPAFSPALSDLEVCYVNELQAG